MLADAYRGAHVVCDRKARTSPDVVTPAAAASTMEKREMLWGRDAVVGAA